MYVANDIGPVAYSLRKLLQRVLAGVLALMLSRIIFSSGDIEGGYLGTFSVYHRSPRGPNRCHLTVVSGHARRKVFRARNALRNIRRRSQKNIGSSMRSVPVVTYRDLYQDP